MNHEVFHGPQQNVEQSQSPEKGLHNRVVHFSGVTSSGKDFLLDRSLTDFDAPNGITRISMGSLLSEHHALQRDEMTKTVGLKGNYDSMMAVLPKILDRAPVVFNSHILPQYNGMLLLNPEFERELSPSQYIVVANDPDRIYDWRIRRNQTSDRQSDIQNPEMIHFHQQLVLSTAETMARENDSGLVVIYNTPDKTDENVAILRDIFVAI